MIANGLTPTALRALRSKYERMLALRVAHARAEEDPSFVEPDPRATMAKLADEYPGALREIDTLPIDVIRERIALLERAERDSAMSEPWMSAQIYFHRVSRGALIAKRWLHGRKVITEELRSQFAAVVPTLDPDALLVGEDLEHVALPPNGRLTTFVYRKVASLLGRHEGEVRALVFFVRPRPDLLRGRP